MTLLSVLYIFFVVVIAHFVDIRRGYYTETVEMLLLVFFVSIHLYQWLHDLIHIFQKISNLKHSGGVVSNCDQSLELSC